MQMPQHVSPATDDNEERKELSRLRDAYVRRKKLPLAERYSRTNPGHLYTLQEREATMASLFRHAGLKSLAGLRILDVGCGRGEMLRLLLEYRADPELLHGIDLLPEHVEDAHAITPNIHFSCGSATRLPHATASCDLVFQLMLFTSVLSVAARRGIAEEIGRVLKPGGHFLWYDMAFNNPRNPDVRGVGLSEIRRLFPNFSIQVHRRITVAAPLGRALGRFGPSVYHLTSRLRVLNTHNFCLLTKS